MKKYLTYFIICLPLISYSQLLEDYLQIAAENNPSLQAEYQEFEAALQRISQVTSLPDPNISFGYFLSPIETRVGPQLAKISLLQIFPWFGTLAAKGNVRTYEAEAAYQQFLDKRNHLYYEVESAYYPIYELRKWIQLEAEELQILETYKSLATHQFEQGKSGMVDVLEIDMMMHEVKVSLELLRAKEKPLVSTFNQLLNRQPGISVQVPDTLRMLPNSENWRKDSLLTAHPILKKLDDQFMASNAQAIVAKKQGLPRIGVGLDYAMIGNRKDMVVPNNGRDVLMPFVSLSLPIYRKKHQAAVNESELLRKKYYLKKKSFANSLIAQYEALKYDLTEQEKLWELYEHHIHASQQMLTILLQAYQNSGADFDEVLRVHRHILKNKRMQVSAGIQFHIAQARMKYLTAYSY